jgi:CBS domain containing-hemolysin-like protein
MFSTIMLAIGLAGLTALLMHASTISFPRLLALKASPHTWHKVFWIPVGLSWAIWPVRFLVKVKEREMRRFMRVPKLASKEVGLRAEIEALDDETNDLMSSGIRQIVGNTLQLRNLDAQDILMPRNQIQVLELNDSIEKNLALAKSSGHTRFPLCDGDLDHCVGIVHVKDVFRQMAEGKEVKLDEIKRDFATFSPEIPLIEVLQKMLQGRLHMALVRDEFGGIDGVITLEDILEEVVGEIQDEFDADEHSVEKLGDGKWRVPGLTPVHELPEELKLEEDDEEEELTSFGGFVTRELGRIPEKGETVDLQHLKVAILEADETRVLSAEVTLSEERLAQEEGG